MLLPRSSLNFQMDQLSDFGSGRPHPCRPRQSKAKSCGAAAPGRLGAVKSTGGLVRGIAGEGARAP